MNNFEWCDDIDAPLMAVAVNPFWWADNYPNLHAWCEDHSGAAALAGMIHLPHEETKTLFILRWG